MSGACGDGPPGPDRGPGKTLRMALDTGCLKSDYMPTPYGMQSTVCREEAADLDGQGAAASGPEYGAPDKRDPAADQRS
ncbi:hypothetical protein Amsp01_028620 [Amycolatopsis sp. NBRC 101858]|nr:hypothetical protein Amsp01_028620 [Amycolatopsis sp. NBRC 101858]